MPDEPQPVGWEQEFERRFVVEPGANTAGAVRLGFVFGPHALQRLTKRTLRLRVATGDGVRIERRHFAGAAAWAEHWTAEMNASFLRAGIDGAAECSVRVAAIGTWARPEWLARGPNPRAYAFDLLNNSVVDAVGGAPLAAPRPPPLPPPLPLECWAARHGLNSVIAIADWLGNPVSLTRRAWGGYTPRIAQRSDNGVVFYPVSIVDAFCARVAFGAAHEFGHQLGAQHEELPPDVAPIARGYVHQPDTPHELSTVMAMGTRAHRTRRLEWSRPAPPGQTDWPFGDAEHNDAAWLRTALPLLAQQRFRCVGSCGGRCA